MRVLEAGFIAMVLALAGCSGDASLTEEVPAPEAAAPDTTTGGATDDTTGDTTGDVPGDTASGGESDDGAAGGSTTDGSDTTGGSTDDVSTDGGTDTADGGTSPPPPPPPSDDMPPSDGSGGTADDSSGDTGGDSTDEPAEMAVPAIYAKFSGVTIYLDGDDVVIETTTVPDHGSPYFETTDSRYEAYNGTNPNYHQSTLKISSQNLTFRIPSSPQEATTKGSAPMGPMGISLNGVPFFNQYAAGGVPLSSGEINSFDQYNGHPQQQGMYHYHVEPVYLTATAGRDALVGVLLDGFPVYGPIENGAEVAEADLDEYHGHFSVTVDYPDGIYHYHVTGEDPYINGNGFYGVPGTVSQ
jgi:hypothetical protein